MKKKSHILLTGRIACPIFASNDASVLWGSILPDLMLLTCIRPHTWEKTRLQTFRAMRRLSRTGCTGSFSALRLGCILHFIEDYFTFPHNKNFKGSIEDHIKFENAQADLLSNYILKEPVENSDKKSRLFSESENDFTEINDVIAALKSMHKEYMQKKPGFNNDLLYASRAVLMVSKYYAYAFASNEERFFEFPVLPNLNHIVNIPHSVAAISLMTKAERLSLT